MANQPLFIDADHIGIKAADMEQAIQFYTEVLGFSLLQRIKPGDVELVFVKLGNVVVELVEDKAGEKYADGVVNHLALKVSDIFAAVELLRRRGTEMLTPEPISLGGGRYNIFFRGPSGEKLELLQG